ncbi:MAG: NIPSNAP family protein [Candidatus Dormibacteraceae bacterium]
MVVEVRNYRTKPGAREEFLAVFAQRGVPALRDSGISVLGPLRDLENPNRFSWLRAFPSLEDRERMRDAFYDSPVWKDELESLLMPLLESYDFHLCEAAPGCVFDL